jgi:hypothetical protein
MSLKRATRNLLLAFVLISIGFGLGQEVALRQAAKAASSPAGGEAVAADQDKVQVTYLRSSFRCITCNLVETLTDDLIRGEFAHQIEAGRLDWRTVDYLQDRQLARRYQVSGNMIVVARLERGEEVAAIRLDRVLELVTDRESFLGYVRSAIHQALEGGDL